MMARPHEAQHLYPIHPAILSNCPCHVSTLGPQGQSRDRGVPGIDKSYPTSRHRSTEDRLFSVTSAYQASLGVRPQVPPGPGLRAPGRLGQFCGQAGSVAVGYGTNAIHALVSVTLLRRLAYLTRTLTPTDSIHLGGLKSILWQYSALVNGQAIVSV